jgi:hypothetical protein
MHKGQKKASYHSMKMGIIISQEKHQREATELVKQEHNTINGQHHHAPCGDGKPGMRPLRRQVLGTGNQALCSRTVRACLQGLVGIKLLPN